MTNIDPAHWMLPAADLPRVRFTEANLVEALVDGDAYYLPPNSFEAAQITCGGIASGWIRSETTAAEITIDTANNVQINYVPII